MWFLETGTTFFHLYSLGGKILKLDSNKEKLYAIEGVVPNPLYLPLGCRFAPRCPYAQDVCQQKEPALLEVGSNRWVSCWLRIEEGK